MSVESQPPTPPSVPPPSRVDSIQSGPPYSLASVTLTGGYFEADPSALEALCTAVFGSGSGYAPASDLVFFDLGAVTESRRDGIDPEPWAFLCFRMLVRSRGGADTRAVVTHAFVDRVPAMIVGREVFGFPAVPAVFKADTGNVATTIQNGGTVSVAIDAFAHGASRISSETIVEVDLPRPDIAAVSKQWDWTGEAPAGVPAVIPFRQLMQIRDAVDPARACFQDLIQGKLTAVSAGVTAGSNPSITLHEFRSFLLASAFGLPTRPAERSSVTRPIPTRGYYATDVTLDFDIPKAKAAEPARSGRDGAPFRFRSGDPQFAPDYEFLDVEVTGFRVPASRARLRELVDTQLNEPFPERGYRYEPASFHIIIECLEYGSMLAANPPPGFQITDSTSQRELIFRILVGRVDEGSRVARKPSLFCPFLFVDSGWSLVSGREIIGYPKALADFRQLIVGGELEGCVIDAPDQTGGKKPVLTLDCRARRTRESIEQLLAGGSQVEPSNEPRPRRVREPFQQLWWGFDQLQGSVDLDAFIRPWLRGTAIGYGAVQPKYFVGAGSPDSLRYGELLEGDYTIRNMNVDLPTHRATLTFDRDDAFGLMNDLGLGEHLVVPPESWYRATCDFRVRIFDPLA